MPFSTEVRLEIARVPVEKKCCARAELVGAVLASGGLSFKGLGRYGLCVYADRDETAARYIDMMRRFFHCQAALGAAQTARLGGRTRYAALPTEGDIPGLLKALKLLDKAQMFGLRAVPERSILLEPCCRVAFLRGAYLAGGSTGNPERAYHLEIAVADAALAACIAQVLEGFGILARCAERKTQQVVYIKDGEYMAHALTLLGAHKALLELENVRIYKEIRNGANRQANCDTANVDKTLAAAERQISMIQAIDKKLGLENLPAPLYDIAQLRLKYPDASLLDLGEMATPRIGKSGVNARMRRLEALAEELVNE